MHDIIPSTSCLSLTTAAQIKEHRPFSGDSADKSKSHMPLTDGYNNYLAIVILLHTALTLVTGSHQSQSADYRMHHKSVVNRSQCFL
jgi:hypothetical protein